MPRNISFALTTPQFLDGSKTVTRRMGWVGLKPGNILCAIEKSQGLGKGGKVKKLGMIRIINVRREPLNRITEDLDYGWAETKREGFEGTTKAYPSEFVRFFCDSHKGCTPDSEITRIEFDRIPFNPQGA